MPRRTKADLSEVARLGGRTVASLSCTEIPLLQGMQIEYGSFPILSGEDRREAELHPLFAGVTRVTKKRGVTDYLVRYQPLTPYYDWCEHKIVQLNDPEIKRICNFSLPSVFAQHLVICTPPPFTAGFETLLRFRLL